MEEFIKCKFYYGKRGVSGCKFQVEEIRLYDCPHNCDFSRFKSAVQSLYHRGVDRGDLFYWLDYLSYEDLDREHVRITTSPEFHRAIKDLSPCGVVKFYIEMKKEDY